MKTRWKNSEQANTLIKSLSRFLSLTKDNDVSYKIGAEFYIDALLENVRHNIKLSHDSLFQNFRTAITEVYKINKLKKSDKILPHFNKICNNILKKEKKYVVICQINFPNNLKLKRRKINKCYIYFHISVPRKYEYHRAKHISTIQDLRQHDNHNCQYASIHVQAPNPEHALLFALKALDIYRAIWQCSVKTNNIDLFAPLKGKYNTDSFIQNGPISTVHLKTGTIAQNIHWEQDTTLTPIKISDLSGFEEDIAKRLSCLKKNSLKAHIEAILVNFITALDTRDHELRFLKLCTAMERAVCSDQTKDIAKRYSFLFKEYEIERVIITSIRNARNLTAHTGIAPPNKEMKSFLMQRYVKILLDYLLRNQFRWKNTSEFVQFISTTVKIDEIDNQIRRLKMVKDFMK